MDSEFSIDRIPRARGAKITLKSYVREDDDEIGISEGDEVSIVRGACVANNSDGSMISGRLARSLGLKPSDKPVKIRQLFFGDTVDLYPIKNGPLRVEHAALPNGFVLVYPCIVPSL